MQLLTIIWLRERRPPAMSTIERWSAPWASAFFVANGCVASSNGSLYASSEVRPDGAAREVSSSQDEAGPGRRDAGPLREGMVEFHITPGTGRRGWNDPSTPVIVRVGGTIRIMNDDATAAHGLHTDGQSPCPHQAPIRLGDAYDCVVKKPFSTGVDGTPHDHYRELRGNQELFWIRAE